MIVILVTEHDGTQWSGEWPIEAPLRSLVNYVDKLVRSVEVVAVYPTAERSAADA